MKTLENVIYQSITNTVATGRRTTYVLEQTSQKLKCNVPGVASLISELCSSRDSVNNITSFKNYSGVMSFLLEQMTFQKNWSSKHTEILGKSAWRRDFANDLGPFSASTTAFLMNKSSCYCVPTSVFPFGKGDNRGNLCQASHNLQDSKLVSCNRAHTEAISV